MPVALNGVPLPVPVEPVVPVEAGAVVVNGRVGGVGKVGEGV